MPTNPSKTEFQETNLLDQSPIVVEKTFNATAERLWKALTDPQEMKKWYFDLPDFKPEIGCNFEFMGGVEDRQYRHLCTVTDVVPGRKLAYSWRYDGYEGNSMVTFELHPEGATTRLKLTHEGLHTFPQNVADFAKSNFVAGWDSIVNKMLEKYLDQ